MIEITRGTTPIISCIVPEEIPVNEADEIWFTITQNGTMITDRKLSENNVTVENNIISIKLSQTESLKLKTYEKAEVGVQLYRSSDDTRWSLNEPEPIFVKRINKDGEMKVLKEDAHE